MKSAADLRELLERIDRRGYPAYKETKGEYRFEGYALGIDHVQGDPFASPSKISIRLDGTQAGYPKELYDKKYKKTALQDRILRGFRRAIEEYSFRAKGSGKSGLMAVTACGQEILERSACQIDAKSGSLIVRMEVGFPANGRTVNSRELMKIFFDFLPGCVRRTLFYRSLDAAQLRKVAELSENQQYIREQLKKQGLAAFVANGAILPRESGISQRPLKGAVPFCAPSSMEVAMELPHGGVIKGMGIKKGITLIVGGGYHGKSTLLEAIERGVYDHIAGDGREYVITDETAVKLRAEDGRSIRSVDISMFINHLPNGKDTTAFSTEDASGSTSQAANVVESMEAGAGVFLIDEDTSATNFMIRDELMQRVVHRDSEPITPFVDRIRDLYEQSGISTILVAGSSGSYFHKADCIIQMDSYRPVDITGFAKQEAAKYPLVTEAAPDYVKPRFVRIPKRAAEKQERMDARGHGSRRGNGGTRGAGDRVKIKTMGLDTISLNKENIDMRYVEQLVDVQQLNMLGQLLHYAGKNCFDGRITLREAVEKIYGQLEAKGFGMLAEGENLPSNLAMPRKQELFACMNRYRGLYFN